MGTTDTSQENERVPYLNPKDFYGEHLDSWEDSWNDESSHYQNLANIIQQSVFIPNKALMLPIAATYMMISSKWSIKCGILFSYGDEGSGKSEIAKIAARLHGQKTLLTPTTTFAGIRNDINSMRWIDPASKEFEKDGAILCWDNLHTETLERDLKIYQMLLFGYDRNTDKISIANSDGTNIDYFVYCPKIISSVSAIHLVPEFGELIRRIILIPHKKYEKFSPEEKKEYEGVDINLDRIPFESISWEGFEEKFFVFWNDKKNCQDYVAWRKQLTKKGKKAFALPPTITSANWTISIDLVVTGLLIGTWSSIQDAVDHLGEYWSYINANYLAEGTATIGHLHKLIEQEAGTQLKANELLVSNGMQTQKIIIGAQKVKDYLCTLQNEGKLDITPRTKDITRLMNTLGWKLTTKGWEQR